MNILSNTIITVHHTIISSWHTSINGWSWPKLFVLIGHFGPTFHHFLPCSYQSINQYTIASSFSSSLDLLNLKHEYNKKGNSILIYLFTI
ncbi:hypothetical protein WN944_021678 [Citrus x changshan-huyou]|uniref:Uncharacterized protein n=1 Tax=Citrus x changshan-huyou TaxID=2935761 RepID=A0AAP0MXB1_9ROSI